MMKNKQRSSHFLFYSNLPKELKFQLYKQMVDHQSNQSLIRIFQKLDRITAHTLVLKKKKKKTDLRFSRILQEILVGFMTKIRTLFHFYPIFSKCRN